MYVWQLMHEIFTHSSSVAVALLSVVLAVFCTQLVSHCSSHVWRVSFIHGCPVSHAQLCNYIHHWTMWSLAMNAVLHHNWGPSIRKCSVRLKVFHYQRNACHTIRAHLRGHFSLPPEDNTVQPVESLPQNKATNCAVLCTHFGTQCSECILWSVWKSPV